MSEFWLHAREFFHGMAVAGYRRQLRGDAIVLQDLFLLLCFMEMLGLPNPAALYLLDVYPYFLDEFHLWHRRMGMDRSPLSNVSCC
ncbi:MAG TPA: cory-CC-star protein [Vicinamibacterales bacterium]|jgi:hypothetical protein